MTGTSLKSIDLHPELDDTRPGTLVSAKRVFLTNWNSLLIIDTKLHLKRCALGQFEIKLKDLAGKGERVWESDKHVGEGTSLYYDFILLVDSLERCRDSYSASSGILQERVFHLIEQPEIFQNTALHEQVAECIHLQRQGVSHCAEASRTIRELKSELAEIRALWHQDKFSPPESDRLRSLRKRSLKPMGKPLNKVESDELMLLEAEHFLVFRKNVVGAYLKLRFSS